MCTRRAQVKQLRDQSKTMLSQPIVSTLVLTDVASGFVRHGNVQPRESLCHIGLLTFNTIASDRSRVHQALGSLDSASLRGHRRSNDFANVRCPCGENALKWGWAAE